MNVENKIKEMQFKINCMQDELNILKKEYSSCKDFTSIFLNVCKKYGIKKIAIQAKHKSIPESMSFPFGVNGSVFSDNTKFEGWPAIWSVVKEVNIAGGCGNHNQHSANCSNLIDGIYHLRSDKWIKIKEA